MPIEKMAYLESSAHPALDVIKENYVKDFIAEEHKMSPGDSDLVDDDSAPSLETS